MKVEFYMTQPLLNMDFFRCIIQGNHILCVWQKHKTPVTSREELNLAKYAKWYIAITDTPIAWSQFCVLLLSEISLPASSRTQYLLASHASLDSELLTALDSQPAMSLLVDTLPMAADN